MADETILRKIESEIQKQIQTAVQFALEASYPDLREVDQHVYA
jgi:TPP-dependent pyruvate/acetoin dehydrogenase alpha subunit